MFLHLNINLNVLGDCVFESVSMNPLGASVTTDDTYAYIFTYQNGDNVLSKIELSTMNHVVIVSMSKQVNTMLYGKIRYSSSE